MSSLHESAKADPLRDIFVNGGEMGRLMSTIDWSCTPLGPIESWPQSLRTALSICLASRFPILIWWGQDLVTLYNDAYRVILGTARHPRALGQRGEECWPEIWDALRPMLESVLYEGKSTWSDDQLLLLDRNGYIEECYFAFSYSPIRDESGGVGGVFTAVTETTGHILSERRPRTLRELAALDTEAETQERQQAQRLQKLTQETIQARNEFISMISHDLKNPLGAIKGYAQLLERMFKRLQLEPSTAERMASSLKGIDATVVRMTMLVNELLDLAHLQAGQPIQLSYQLADLIAIIRQVLAEQQQIARKHRLRIETALEELRGSFDITRVGRVISNLIANAIKYSPKGSEIIVRVTQEADLDQGGPYAIIAVQDHGIGIPAQDLPHIFEQFHRGKNVVGKIPGTGLGLASVQHILERHGGTVSVSSEEGVGSTFTIRLPLQKRPG